MSLSKQLLLLLSLIFFIVFSASRILSINNIKSYLEVESQFHVKDTATSLGLSLSPYMENEQDPILETMITAIFVTGYYREMRLENIDNQELVKLTNSQIVPDVPAWFIELVPMQGATAVSEISSGRQMSGKLYVTSNPAYGYLKLYQQAQSPLIVSGLIFLAAMLLLTTVLRYTPRPLHDITQQAEQISAGHFTTITKLPWTREIKHVALSMNSMSDKIGHMISRLNRRLEIVSESLKQDPLTKLLNRTTFQVNLKQPYRIIKAKVMRP
jgi:methyl-accepting chemotaxis protein